jgi:CubicO group peptidase (beta-lactamase class C family)
MRRSALLLPRLSLALLLLAGVAAYAGPGPGAWEVGAPAEHGLDAAALAAAAERVAEAVPYRHCMVVVKDGRIMHERYAAGNTSESRFETDSVGKTMVAALVGAAVTKGLLDLDAPLRSYGVVPRPDANWSVGAASHRRCCCLDPPHFAIICYS